MSDEGMTGEWYSYGDVQRFIEAETETLRAKIEALEQENARLKRMYADMALENAAIKDVLSRKL